MADVDRIAREVSRKTRGLARACDLTERGIAPSTMSRRVARQVWSRPLPGVIDVTRERSSWERRVLAAVMTCPKGTLASHKTAAALHGLPGFGRSGRIEVTVPRSHRSRDLPFTVHSTLHVEHGVVLDGIPCASGVRTLLGLATCVDDRSLARGARDALRRGLVRAEELMVPSLDNLHGITRTRELVAAEHDAALLKVESPLEEESIDKLLATPGLPTFTTQLKLRIGGKRVRPDVAWPELLLVLEIRGGKWHADQLAIDAYAARKEVLEGAGWTVIDLTVADLADEAAWDRFVARLRRAISVAQAAHPRTSA